jgi:hypothetical protein
MALVEACRVCRGKPFHRLGCPLLTKIATGTAIFFGIVTAVLLVVWLAGGPRGNVLLGAVLTALFAAYGMLSRARTSR